VEAAEGLYLSCRPRYSRRKMGSKFVVMVDQWKNYGR
jgi:hypothetical protein